MSNLEDQSDDIQDEIEEVIELLPENKRATPHMVGQAKHILQSAAYNLLQGVKNVKTPKIKSNSNKRTITIVLSDDHIGKQCYDINSKQTIVTFNIDIARARINHLFERAFEEINENPDLYDEIVIALLGDHIEGDGNIFKTQAFEIIESASQQMLHFEHFLVENIIKCSKIMEASGGIVRVIGVPGNHGEQRKRYVDHPRDNWDYLILMNIEYLVKLDQSKFHNVIIDYEKDIDQRLWRKYEVKGWSFLLQHILTPNFTTTAGNRELLTLQKRNLDVVLTGHLHSESLANIGGITVIRSGSLGGYDEFAANIRATISEASHPILITTKKNKIHSYITVTFDGIN